MTGLSQVISAGWFLWAPLTAAALHVFEEFVFPGGFMQWYSRYRGSSATATKSFLWKINALLLASCFYAGYNLTNSWLWVSIIAVLGANGMWHAWASLRSRSYSPGTVTGVLVYLPLAVLSIGQLALTGSMRPTTWIAAGAGALYPLWSAMFHARKPDFTVTGSR